MPTSRGPNFLFAFLLAYTALVTPLHMVHAQPLTIAAAADLKFALDDILTAYQRLNPDDKIDIVYGSSGRFAQQIENGAPFDLFFSASMEYPVYLQAKGFAATEPKRYALGRIVIWSRRHDASQVSVADLLNNNYRRVAIASPDHAPYGVRSKEALQSQGIWDDIQSKLVIGENIAHTAQLIESGAANIGIIALSLALNPQLAQHGGYYLIPDDYHAALEQAYIITQRAKNNLTAYRFAAFMNTTSATDIMVQYGFVVKEDH